MTLREMINQKKFKSLFVGHIIGAVHIQDEFHSEVYLTNVPEDKSTVTKGFYKFLEFIMDKIPENVLNGRIDEVTQVPMENSPKDTVVITVIKKGNLQ